MDLYRFYLPGLKVGQLALSDEESHHATRVLRLEQGQQVEVFDGQGHSAPATLHVAGRKVTLDVAEVRSVAPWPITLEIATAIPKADRAEQLIEQASQLDVACIRWLETDRGVVKPRESGAKMDKFRRLAIESAKQCGRAYLMGVEPMESLEALLARHPGEIWWLEPHGGKPLGELRVPASILALVGPEGGWSPREIALLSVAPQVVRLRLNPSILRIETAVAAIAAIVMSRI